MSDVKLGTDTKIGVAKLILSALIAVIVSLGLILVFALMIKWFQWGDAVIAPVNIIIKIVSIGVGVIVATRSGSKALTKGIIVGAGYIVLSYISFSALLGSFSLSIGNLWDLLFGMIVGGIVGIITNVVRR